MKLRFAYSADKDIENIIKSTKSVNNKQPTEFQNLYAQKYGNDFAYDKIGRFISEQDALNRFNIKKEIATIEERWKKIELVFVKRVEKIFGIIYPFPAITAYLTHNERCTYNIEGNYFFVRIGSEFSNNTVMHELFHFYTYYAFGKKLLDKGFSTLLYNDIKESLTELLNLEFADLLNGKPDNGYVQHKNMRAEIRELWPIHKDLGQIIDSLVHRV